MAEQERWLNLETGRIEFGESGSSPQEQEDERLPIGFQLPGNAHEDPEATHLGIRFPTLCRCCRNVVHARGTFAVVHTEALTSDGVWNVVCAQCASDGVAELLRSRQRALAAVD